MTRTRIRVLAKAGIVAGLAALGIGVLAGSASSHTPKFSEGCDGYSVSLTNYGQGSTRKLVVDGTTLADGGFSGDYITSATWDQTKSHTITLVVHSSDGPSGDVNWLATQQPCQEGSTTSAEGTTTTAAGTTTTEATTTTVTSTPVSQVTTSPPTSAAPTSAAAPTAPTEPNVPTTTLQQGPPRAAAPPSTLAVTGGGGDSPLLVGMGAALVLGGIILLVTTRRRLPA